MKVEKSNARNGWRTVRLGEICEQIDYGFTASADFSIREPRFLRITDIQNGRVDWNSVPGCKISNAEIEQHQLRDGDIVFARTGATTGKSFLIQSPPKTVFASYLIRLRLKSECDPEFVSLFLQGEDYWRQIRSQARGGAQPNFNATMLAGLRVILPPKDEQRRIAARLREQMAAVERARAAVENQLDAAQKLPAALLRAVFTSPAAQRWQVVLVGDVAEVVGGMQKTPGRAPRQFHKQFLTVRNVQRGYLDLSNVERFEVTPAEFERLRLQRGDLLIVEGNGSVDHIGRNALFNEDGEWIHQNHIIRVRLPDEKFAPEFVSYYLNSDAGRAQMLEKAKTTTGLYTLSTKKVAALNFPTPSKTEQRTIATRLESELSAARALGESLSMRLAEVERLPAALLRQAFSSN